MHQSTPILPVTAPRAPSVNRLRLQDGTTLRYYRQGVTGRLPILMLHGYTDSSFSFSRVLPLLPPEQLVIVPDQRGHGDSDKPEDGYSMEVMARDALHLLEALQVERAMVVGHSMGTFVARQMAAVAPQRVARLMLVDPGPATNTVLRELSDAVLQLSDPVDPAFAREFQYSTIQRPVPDEFMELVVRESLKLPARVWRAALAAQMSYEPVEELIACPTLVIGGAQDGVFSAPEQRAIAAAIPGARLTILEGIGHTPHWEDPGGFVATLLDELAS